MHPVEDTPRETVFCSECGGKFPADEVVRFGERRVCASCKEVFAQRLREGGLTLRKAGYGGFWIRVLASTLDALIQAAVIMPIQVALTVAMTLHRDPTFGVLATIATYLVGLILGLAYEAFFVVKYAATPGKMACRLRIQTAEGHPLTWSRAVGRYFAKYVSGLTLGIGFLLAGLDEQKRTLHDHICSTRVVKRTA